MFWIDSFCTSIRRCSLRRGWLLWPPRRCFFTFINSILCEDDETLFTSISSHAWTSSADDGCSVKGKILRSVECQVSFANWPSSDTGWRSLLIRMSYSTAVTCWHSKDWTMKRRKLRNSPFLEFSCNSDRPPVSSTLLNAAGSHRNQWTMVTRSPPTIRLRREILTKKLFTDRKETIFRAKSFCAIDCYRSCELQRFDILPFSAPRRRFFSHRNKHNI